MAAELLSEQLRTRTLPKRQQLEKLIGARLRLIRSTEDYVRMLQLFYSYFAGLENKIVLYIGTAELPDMPQRRKSGNLIVDMIELGGQVPLRAPLTYLPEITTVAQAFGALYVIESSMLDGQAIYRMMEKQTGLQKGLSFFNGYGRQTEPMWDSFQTILDAQQGPEEIIESADAVFDSFSLWVKHFVAH